MPMQNSGVEYSIQHQYLVHQSKLNPEHQRQGFLFMERSEI